MIILLNKEIEPLLFDILSLDRNTAQPVSGLLTENISLGAKRRLQKIRTILFEKFEEFKKDSSEIYKTLEIEATKKLPEGITLEKCKSSEIGSKTREKWDKILEETNIELSKTDKKSFIDEEINKLLNEEVKIDKEKVSLNILEAIITEHNYNFDILEKISE